ncbi:hypothetical protein [Methylocystis sp. SB2]|uniref:hypothetical protein n=1 Tax=Methylocystis sp. (strain SB2) TaxID=743836 RepID=UPI0004204127|nr:hypothetical protein [Methylocystis sp. SB2]ULO25088.1 hypothetical protein LNB28_06785 [Methylocystis sp. SB2]
MSESSEPGNDPDNEAPKGLRGGRAIRAVLNAAGGAIPFVGGILSAGAGAWSEQEQEKINTFFEHWLKMLQDEMVEKAQTILEIMARLDMNDEKIAQRVASPEYQSLVRKAFRDWSGTESEEKRKFVRNILANAAASSFTSDDVVRMFLQWISIYSEMHFTVISSIYNDKGVTRARIWEKIGKDEVREDSAEADLFKLLIRDLSTGSIIRQHREKDYTGNFLRVPAQRRRRQPASNTVESAFEDTKGYELTELGQQFVHYAMSDLPIRIEFKVNVDAPEAA